MRERDRHLRPPLGILTLASRLIPKGYTVKLIDQRVDTNWKEVLNEHLKEDTICVGISSMSGYQIDAGLATCRYLRELDSRVPIVWGGVHPTIETKTTIENDYVDLIVIGEGDITFLELVTALKNSEDLRSVNGIAFMENGQIIRTPERPVVDLNAMPPVLFEIVDLDKYREKDLHYELEGELTLSIETSRGCPHKCQFCSESRSPLPWRSMSPQRIIEEIKRIVHSYGTNSFTIVDDNFFVSRHRAEEFCDLLIAEGVDIEWYTNCRPEYVARYDDSFLKKLSRSGCKCLTFGAESGSERVLKLIQKGASREHFLVANRKMRAAQIVPWFVTISGFPFDDLQSIEETYLMVMQLLRENPAAKSGVEPLIPTPGTDVTDACYAKAFERPQSLEEWAKIRKRTDWVDEEVVDFLRRNEYLLDLISLRNSRVFLSSVALGLFARLLQWRIKSNNYSLFVEPKIVRSLLFQWFTSFAASPRASIRTLIKKLAGAFRG